MYAEIVNNKNNTIDFDEICLQELKNRYCIETIKVENVKSTFVNDSDVEFMNVIEVDILPYKISTSNEFPSKSEPISNHIIDNHNDIQYKNNVNCETENVIQDDHQNAAVSSHDYSGSEDSTKNYESVYVDGAQLSQIDALTENESDSLIKDHLEKSTKQLKKRECKEKGAELFK